MLIIRGMVVQIIFVVFFFFKQKTAYEMRISDWSSDVCSSDLDGRPGFRLSPSLANRPRRARPRPARRRTVLPDRRATGSARCLPFEARVSCRRDRKSVV